MAGSTFGTLYRVTTWGESHGAGIGCVIDGCPAGLQLGEQDIQKYLDRRKPGQSRFTTSRSEADRVRILSGVFEGQTEGTPIALFVENTDQHSKDYSNLKDVYRPGHADLGFDRRRTLLRKRDNRKGDGRSGRRKGPFRAGRLTPGLCQVHRACGLQPGENGYGTSSGEPAPDARCRGGEAGEAYLNDCMSRLDSAGGVVECRVDGLPAGIGEPVFDKLDGLLGHALFSIGAVKAVEIGDGTAVSSLAGHEDNDQFGIAEDGTVRRLTNHAGGILGGMSDGGQVILRAFFKPTPSIAREQQALGKDGEVHALQIRGRHDPVIVPRAAVVVECMTAITILDLMLRNMGARMSSLKDVYR